MAYDLAQVAGTSPAVSYTAAAKFGAGLATGYVGVATSPMVPAFCAGAKGTAYNPSVSASLECWVRRSDATGIAQTEVMVGEVNIAWLGIATDGSFIHSSQAGDAGVNTGLAICDNAWHHLAVVWNPTAGKLVYLCDGVVTDTVLVTKTTVTSRIFGLRCSPQSMSSIDMFADQTNGGCVDEVSICSPSPYSVSAVGQTYAVPTAAFSASRSGQIALYHLDDSLADSNATIAATDPKIIYSPGNWGLDGAGGLKTVCNGAYLRGAINTPSGTTDINLLFDTSGVGSPAPQISYRIDAGPWAVQEVAASIAVPIPASNTWNKHVIEVVAKASPEYLDRWGGNATKVGFRGFAAATAITSAPLPASNRRALFIGDSITEGIKTLAIDKPTETDNNDARQSWAFMQRDLLGIEVGVVGFGFIGVHHVGNGGVPVVQESIANLWSSGPARTFTGYDLIVVNIGTNDGDATTATFVAGYVTLLNTLLATSGTATVVAMRPFNGARAAEIQTAIGQCAAPGRVIYLDTTGFFTADSGDGVHPYGIAAQQIAPAVAQQLRAVLDAKKTVLLSSNGVAIPAAAYGL